MQKRNVAQRECVGVWCHAGTRPRGPQRLGQNRVDVHVQLWVQIGVARVVGAVDEHDEPRREGRHGPHHVRRGFQVPLVRPLGELQTSMQTR